MKLKNNFLLVTLVIITISACKKYPDGPFVSFRARDARVINEWAVEKVLVNGQESTPFYSKYTYKFASDLTYMEDNGFNPINGTWALIADDDSLVVNFNGNQVLHKFKILKLKNKSLWLIEDHNTTIYEYHFKTK